MENSKDSIGSNEDTFICEYCGDETDIAEMVETEDSECLCDNCYENYLIDCYSPYPAGSMAYECWIRGISERDFH